MLEWAYGSFCLYMDCGLLVRRVVADYNPRQNVLAEWRVFTRGRYCPMHHIVQAIVLSRMLPSGGPRAPRKGVIIPSNLSGNVALKT